MAFNKAKITSSEETLWSSGCANSSYGVTYPVISSENNASDLWGDLAPSPRGMQNSGTNTCYLNSVLQMLSFTPEVFRYLTTSRHTETCNKSEFCLMCELQNHVMLLTNERSTTTSCINPQCFIDNISKISENFHVPQQQDALECLTSIIDKLKHQEPSLAQKFYFNMCHILTCKSCGAVKSSSDSNNVVLLNPDPLGKSSIERAMCNITESEVVSDFKCDFCEKKVAIEKSSTIDQPPEVLICQINRFNSRPDSKITNFVSYPEKLDISPFLTSSNIPVNYNLHSVIIHNGDYSTSGHYLVFIKAPSGKWFRLNDTKVSEVSEKTVLHQRDAYVCIYQKDQIDRQSVESVPSNASNVCLVSKCDSLTESVETMSDTPRKCNKRKLDSDMLPSQKKCKIENVSKCEDVTESVEARSDTPRKCYKRKFDLDTLPSPKKCKIENVTDERKMLKRKVEINNNDIVSNQKKSRFEEMQSGPDPQFNVRFAPLSSGKEGYYVYTQGLKMIIVYK